MFGVAVREGGAGRLLAFDEAIEDDDGFFPQLSQLVGLGILKPFMLEQPVEASRATAKMIAVSDVNREKLVHMPEMSFEMEYWKGALVLRMILVRQKPDTADFFTGT